MNVTQFNDAQVQQRNLTASQKRNMLATKEGVLINSYKPNISDTCDALVISDEAQLPVRLYEPAAAPENRAKNILPLAAVSVGVMGMFAGITAYVRHNAKILTKLAPEERVADFTRNLAINEETHQAVVRMVINPNRKTMLAGAGVLVLSAMAFMGKTFAEGFKDVWVKKREADIQKNLQERLISIETQSFGGKIRIIRSMLSEKAKEFGNYLDGGPILPNFGRHKWDVPFGHTRHSERSEESRRAAASALLGVGVLGSIVGLGYLSLKNLTASKKHFGELAENITKKITEVVSDETLPKEDVKKTLRSLFQKYSKSQTEIEQIIAQTGWPEAERKDFVKEIAGIIKAPTVAAPDAIGGSGAVKPSFYSHVDDYRAFSYNWLLDTDNKQFKQMFFGITGLTALGYGGKLAGEAIQDVEVKKINAGTEIGLQNRLVSTELRNFKAKKDAAIQPLTDEFYRQAANGKPKEELKVIADNILFEIKNGPPFVYS